MVGDPTGRTSAREVITLEALEHNLAGIQKQLARYLDYEGGKFGDNPAAIGVNNADWLLDLHYIPFLRDIGRHFSVNEMLAIETYKTRLEAGGLNFVEFNYRLVQAYDFLHLFRTEGCLLQMGGSDQWANITGGVELIRKADRGKAFALVSPLITTPSGEKMGKTGSGVRVWLDPDQFSPYDYYQYWVNTEDAMVGTYLRQFTFLLEDEIVDLTSVSGEALREAKRALAFEATALAHGVDQAELAREAAHALFAAPGNRVSAADASLPTTELAAADLTDSFTLADAFVAADLAKSRGEARRLAQQGGLSVDDTKVQRHRRTVRRASSGPRRRAAPCRQETLQARGGLVTSRGSGSLAPGIRRGGPGAVHDRICPCRNVAPCGLPPGRTSCLPRSGPLPAAFPYRHSEERGIPRRRRYSGQPSTGFAGGSFASSG